MLEEAGVDYELRFVDMFKGAHKQPDMLALNPMGKLPVLTDDDTIITESAAIGLYLADRYAAGRLAPALDDPQRGRYLRWCFFTTSVVEPGVMAKVSGWDCQEERVGWGNHEAMLRTMEHALSQGPYLLGESFSMADLLFGGTLRWMLGVKMLAPRPAFSNYAERLGKRPALQRADAKNAAVREEHGTVAPAECPHGLLSMSRPT